MQVRKNLFLSLGLEQREQTIGRVSPTSDRFLTSDNGDLAAPFVSLPFRRVPRQFCAGCCRVLGAAAAPEVEHLFWARSSGG